jgi:uncharacterized protein YfaP (DUF2135 family)
VTVHRLTILLAACALIASASSPASAEKPLLAPSLSITSPRGGQTRARVIKIAGTLHDVAAERLTLVLNGVPLSVPRSGDAFETQQVLAPGPNTIRVLAEEAGGVVADQVTVYALVPPKDLRVTLTWDTPGTDVDLWVTGPDGEKVYYQHKEGTAGGTLDTDVTTGYGPETYTQARAEPGTYRVQAHYYAGGQPSRVTVTVIRGEGTPQEARREFRDVLLATNDISEVGEFVVAR